MTTPTAAPEHDERLRALLASVDPMATGQTELPADIWTRIADDVAVQISDETGSALTDQPEPIHGTAGRDGTPPVERRTRAQGSFARRHWQTGLLVAAALTSLALAAGTVLPGLFATSGSDSSAAGEAAIAPDAAAGAGDADSGGGAPAGRSELQSGGAATDQAARDSAGAAATATKDPTLVRSGSVIVGTDDVQGGRNTFVAEIQRMGGMVMSETVTAQGDDARAAMEKLAASDGISYPYPYPSGPGISLSVKVPAASFDQAMAAARATGEVAQLQQSSYDVGSQVTDVRARIAVLTASLKRLEGLMDEANGVSDVIRLEKAIADRQSELNSLLAQQRELADQTQMSQVSLTLMSPEDARGAVDPQPQLTWWESFVKGMSQFWSWLGQALLIVSPLLIVGGLLWWLRRRRTRGDSTPPSGGTAPETT